MTTGQDGATQVPATKAKVPGTGRHKLLRGTLLTIAGGVLWGINGTVSKMLMSDYGVDPLWMACVRELTACWLFLGATRVSNPGRITEVLRSRRALLGMLSVAVFSILLSQVAYLEAISWTNSATATILQSLSVVLVMVFVCVTSHRLPHAREALGVILAVAGTFLVATGGNFGALSLPAGGLAWGFLCAFAAAVLAIQPVRLMHRWGNFAVNGFAFLMSGLILALVSQPWSHLPVLDARGVGLLLFSIVLGTFGAYGLYLQGVKEVGSMRGSLLSTAEPVTATVTSVLLMGITFSPADLLGFAMIIAMVFLTA